ncbi:MAG TPA: folate-binding protein [Acidobacteriaceae bacterium]|jgi:folate-binding protein YgfZ|nr:folate-binding protein [Acidobacteriaceae bacterium]
MPETAVLETPLAVQLRAAGSFCSAIEIHRGAQTPLRFSGIGTELEALLRSAGIFDLGYRTFLRATGKDRVRWLNGMITQTVKGLGPGQTGATLVLNAQGRIQGDGDVLFHEDHVELETDRSQAERLLGHLRRFIIMDDVQLQELDAARTVLGIAGPRAAEILAQMGASGPEPGTFVTTRLAGAEVTVVAGYGPVAPRWEIQIPAEQVLTVWNGLLGAGATPCGTEALEKLRVLEGVAAFEVDFNDKQLPQETNLFRTLNFTKGCYIGQETVERIRARATLHRSLRQFELEGADPAMAPGTKVELRAGEAAVGELTSVARIEVPGWSKTLALGIARTEALERSESGAETIRYDGGIAVPLAAPPVPANL